MSNEGLFGAMTANSHYLTDIESIKLFMEEAGYLWRTILASTTTTPVTYLNIAPTGGSNQDNSRNAMLKIAELRDLFAENAAYSMNGARQPNHFDHASTLASAARSVESAYATAVKNAVSNIVSKWDTFIKSEAVAASGNTAITTTKAYIDSLFSLYNGTNDDWTVELGATKFGTDFLDFWRYVMRSELSIPILTFTATSSTAWATRTVVPNATSSGTLTYGSALEARAVTTQGSGPVLASFVVTDAAGTSVTVANTQNLTTPYTTYAARDNTNGNYTAIGTKTNIVTVTSVVSTAATAGDKIAIYSV